MLTIDLTLNSGAATATLKDSTGKTIGSAVTLTSAPKRLDLTTAASLSIGGDGTSLYSVLIVHSGTGDSKPIEIASDQGKYSLQPAVSARLGNSVIVETVATVTVSQLT